MGWIQKWRVAAEADNEYEFDFELVKGCSGLLADICSTFGFETMTALFSASAAEFRWLFQKSHELEVEDGTDAKNTNGFLAMSRLHMT